MHVCVGGMPLSPTAASTTVGSPTPFTFSCSLASSAAPGAGDVLSVFELNKPVNGQHYDDSAVPSAHYSCPSIVTRLVQLIFVLLTDRLHVTLVCVKSISSVNCLLAFCFDICCEYSSLLLYVN